MITLNGVSLPAPASLFVRVSPQAGAAQYNTLGRLVQDGMQDKRQVEIRWARLSADALAQLSSLLSAGGFFTLVYPDPLSGNREMRCRAVDQSARVYRFFNGAAQWADVALTLEEQ